MERRLATILAADVGGSLRLIAAGRTMPASLNTYRKAINKPLMGHRGRLRGSAGDGLITELEWPVEAARFAVEIQQESKSTIPICLRIAIGGFALGPTSAM